MRACGGDSGAWERRWRALAAEAPAEDSGEADQEAAPYRGLAAFTAEDAEWFFGREDVVTSVVDRLAGDRFLAVFGASGAGKTSLLRAGVVPAWRRKGKHVNHRPVIVFTPGSRPVEECAVQVANTFGHTVPQVLADLTAGPENLHRLCLQGLAGHPDAELLIVVDQLEELFTLCHDHHEREQFLAMLLATAQAPTSRCRVVLCARADFLPHCAQHPDLATALSAAVITFGPMGTADLRRAITAPAVHAGCVVEGALVTELVARASGQVGMLPLLAHALLQTWRKRRGTTLTLDGYQATGGLEGALARTAEAIHDSLTPARQLVLRALMMRLVAFGEGTSDTKRRLRRHELDGLADIDPMLEQMARARLVVLDEHTVELSHEVLIDAWPRLRTWLDEGRDDLRVQRHITEATDVWLRHDRDPGALLRGARLAAAGEWVEARGDQHTLNRDEHEFVLAGVAARARERHTTRRRVRQLRALALGLAVLLVAMTAISVVALRQRHEAVEAQRVGLSRQLAAQAEVLSASSPGEARSLAARAYRTASTLEARSVLLSLSARRQQRQTFSLGSNTLIEVGFTPDSADVRIVDTTGAQWGMRLADHKMYAGDFGSEQATAAALSADSGAVAVGFPGGRLVVRDVAVGEGSDVWNPSTSSVATIGAIAFGADGTRFATAHEDGGIRLWNRGTASEQATLGHLPATVDALAFAPDGRTVASASRDGAVTLWNTETKAREAVLTGPAVSSLGYSPTGHLLAGVDGAGQVVLWDLTTRVAITLDHQDGTARALAFSTTGLLAVAMSNQQVVLWDTEHRIPRATLSGHETDVHAVAFDRTGTHLAVAGERGNVAVWDLTRSPVIHAGLVTGLAFDPRGEVLAVADYDRMALWDLADRRPRQVLPRQILALAYDPSGGGLATAARDRLELWDPADLRAPLKSDLARTFTPDRLVFSAPGQVLGISDDTLTSWDTRRPDPAVLRPPGPGYTHYLSTNGQLAAVSGDEFALAVVDLRTSTPRSVLPGHEAPVRWAEFSPDGRALASVDAKVPVVRVWDLDTGGRTDLPGYRDCPGEPRFSPDRRLLAYCGVDNTITLWDNTRREPLAILSGHTDAVRALAFSPTGDRLATADNDGNVLLWSTDADHEVG
ncbi:WD40 repeat [Actinokineospora diospyrosa]|uniref:WD40 repeat n=1 Tax=Actinokineospora diospyrosa TaxID=103728 RepID=A0ABT1IC66_9PSEU|nr:WD40 repeat [Actinokineospora diospyrosa]